MNRNLTPRPIKATGARDAHGKILEPSAGSLFVHLHREHGLAHRHYVFRPWQVRVLRVLLSRPMLLGYVVALGTWFWMAQRALRVPLMQKQITTLTKDAERLDELTAKLTELQAQYDQVKSMLSAASASRPASSPVSRPVSRPAARQPVRDSLRDSVRPAVRDTVRPAVRDTVRDTLPPKPDTTSTAGTSSPRR